MMKSEDFNRMFALVQKGDLTKSEAAEFELLRIQLEKEQKQEEQERLNLQRMTPLEKQLYNASKAQEIYYKALQKDEEKDAQGRIEPLVNKEIDSSKLKALPDIFKGVLDSSYEQWENLFSVNPIRLSTPIRVVSDYRIQDLVIILNKFIQLGVISDANTYQSKLEKLNAFEYSGKRVESKRLRNLKNKISDDSEQVKIRIGKTNLLKNLEELFS